MSPREQLLAEVAQALANHTISRQDLESLLPPASAPDPAPVYQADQPAAIPDPTETLEATKSKNNLSIIDVLFYLAGIILFAALMTMVAQLGEDALAPRLIISLGVGLLFWGAAYIVAQQPAKSEARTGLINAMLLTGSLSVIAGGFLISMDLTKLQDSASSSALLYAVVLALLGITHVVFDRLLSNAILIILGLLLIVASFPTAIVGLLVELEPPADVWGVIAIVTGLLLALGGRLIAHSATGREHFQGSFESLAGFVVLMSIYSLGLASDIRIFWQLLLPLLIYAAFFISIQRRSKQFLVTGSFFLVLFLVTVSFQYFAGLGAAFCLILSAFSILGTAFVALNINKKYIKSS